SVLSASEDRNSWAGSRFKEVFVTMLTSVVPIHAPPVLTSAASSITRSIHKLSTVTASWRISMNYGSSLTKKREELSLRIHHPAAFDPKGNAPKLSDLDRLQIPEQELLDINKMEFGHSLLERL
ncbi:unnamed protein product, partial [Linum tenue]